jgi:integrase
MKALSKSFHGLKDAKAWARHAEVQADRHELPPDPKVLQEVPLGDLVRRYRDTVTPRKRGQSSETVVLNKFLRHPICQRKLSEPLVTHFAAYRDERLKEVKPATLKRQLGLIHHMFEIARDEWSLPIRQNPVGKLKLKGTDKRRERRLRDGELDKLLQAAWRCRSPRIAWIIRLAVETGMRRSEILSIRSEHVDLKNRALLLRDTKNNEPRTIPLTRAALALLQPVIGEMDTDDRLFPMTPNAFRLAWERVKKRAGISDLRFHDLRHEAISRLFERGLTTPEVAMISGHRDMRMLFRYSHAMRERVLVRLDNGDG